ncbi:MAG: hypothetical protein AB7E72_16120 [Lysobacterales bacterium]
MKLSLKVILNDPAISDETKQMAIEHEAAVQWYLAACDATAYRIDWSPIRPQQQMKVAA